MAYDDKALKRDGSGITPTPQHFNPVADDYEPLYGRNGASRVELYGPDGTPISTSAGKLDVRASEVETLLTALGIKDYATQTTLVAILSTLQGELTTTLSGSIPEYAWFSNDVTKPTPTEDFAWGNEFNKVTGELKVYGWTGVTWLEVI